jgi:RNA polymerase sigma-32 factor
VQVIAKRLGVTEQDVVDMNRRLGGDASLNAPIRDDGESGEWQDWLVDDAPSQERILAESEESDNRHKALISALDVLNERERRIFEARRLADDPITLEELAAEFGVSRERVRQIEVRAFEKLQRAVKARVVAMETPDQAPATPWKSLTPNRGGLHLRYVQFGRIRRSRAAAEIGSRHQHRHKTTGGDSKERRS